MQFQISHMRKVFSYREYSYTVLPPKYEIKAVRSIVEQEFWEREKVNYGISYFLTEKALAKQSKNTLLPLIQYHHNTCTSSSRFEP